METTRRMWLSLVLVLFALLIGTTITYLSTRNTSLALSDNSTFAYLPLVLNEHYQRQMLYTSADLTGHEIFAECNPGGGTSCPCSSEDASMASLGQYGQVTSNTFERHTYVNAIGYKKFTEAFPDHTPLGLGIYEYRGEFSLTAVPSPTTSQTENGQAVHLMIQFWDGRDALFTSEDKTLEGVIYWTLNPWEPDYGHIKYYTGSLDLISTGFILQPDTEWHTYSLVVDLSKQEYLWIAIDGQRIDMRGIPLARVSQPTWGTDVSLSITTESMATWPKYDCEYVFTWTTRFRNLEFNQLTDVTL